jgi:hypothetical protein
MIAMHGDRLISSLHGLDQVVLHSAIPSARACVLFLHLELCLFHCGNGATPAYTGFEFPAKNACCVAAGWSAVVVSYSGRRACSEHPYRISLLIRLIQESPIPIVGDNGTF